MSWNLHLSTPLFLLLLAFINVFLCRGLKMDYFSFHTCSGFKTMFTDSLILFPSSFTPLLTATQAGLLSYCCCFFFLVFIYLAGCVGSWLHIASWDLSLWHMDSLAVRKGSVAAVQRLSYSEQVGVEFSSQGSTHVPALLCRFPTTRPSGDPIDLLLVNRIWQKWQQNMSQIKNDCSFHLGLTLRLSLTTCEGAVIGDCGHLSSPMERSQWQCLRNLLPTADTELESRLSSPMMTSAPVNNFIATLWEILNHNHPAKELTVLEPQN